MKSVGMNYETAKNHRERISKDRKHCEILIASWKSDIFLVKSKFLNCLLMQKEKVRYTSVLYVSIYLLTH